MRVVGALEKQGAKARPVLGAVVRLGPKPQDENTDASANKDENAGKGRKGKKSYPYYPGWGRLSFDIETLAGHLKRWWSRKLQLLQVAASYQGEAFKSFPSLSRVNSVRRSNLLLSGACVYLRLGLPSVSFLFDKNSRHQAAWSKEEYRLPWKHLANLLAIWHHAGQLTLHVLRLGCHHLCRLEANL